MKKILFSVGEISADIHGANLIKKIRDIDPDAYIGGMGGEKMKQAGADIKFDVTMMSSVGITEYYDFYKDLEVVRDKMLNLIQEENPDLLIFMDMEGFNTDLAVRIKKLGLRTKTLYYITPQRWVLRIIGDMFVKKLGKNVDKIITSFEDEFKFYQKLKIDVEYFGNPIPESIEITKSPEEIRNQFEIPNSKKIISLLPGSRKQEIERLTEIFYESAKIINRKEEAVFITPAVHENFYNIIKKISKKFLDEKNLKIIVTKERSHNIINASDFVILSSGSSTLESAILEKPMVICYKISYITYVLGKIFYRYRYIGLPNILLKEDIVPELLQNKVKPDIIANEVLNIINSNNRKNYIIKKFRVLRDSLDKNDSVVNNVARYIIQLLYNK